MHEQSSRVSRVYTLDFTSHDFYFLDFLFIICSWSDCAVIGEMCICALFVPNDELRNACIDIARVTETDDAGTKIPRVRP